MKLRALVPALAACLVSLSPAGGAAPAPVERVVVRLAQFDVVVRDKKGSLVRDLTASDFEVLEDGVPLGVTAVDAWTGARPAAAAPAGTTPSVAPNAPAGAAPAGDAVPAPTPPAGAAVAGAGIPAPPPQDERRSFVIVFDNLNGTSALRLSQAKRAAERFVLDHFQETDVAAVYQMDLTLRAISGFSQDAREVAGAIRKVSWFPPSTFSDQIQESILAYQSTQSSRTMKERLERSSILEGERLDWTRERIYHTLDDLAGVFEGMEGRRVLVLVSAGFPLTAAGDVERERGGFTLAFRDLIKTLGRLGVTVYSVDVGDDQQMGDASRQIDWRVAVGKLGMDETFLTDVGLDTSLSSGSAGARREFLGVLANETGGRLLTSSDLSRAFATIQEESANFYRVSCRIPEGRNDGRYKRIVIRVRRPDTVVTARRGRYADVFPSAGARAAGNASSRIDSTDRYQQLVLRGSATPLPAAADGRRPIAIVVEAVGPIDLVLDEDGSARIDLEFRAVARVEDEIVARYEKNLPARIRAEGVAAVRRGFRAEARLDLPIGLYDAQATLRVKNPAQLGTWSGPLAVPPEQPRAGIRFAGGILSRDAENERPLLLRAQVPASGSDPLDVAPGFRLLPPAEATFAAGGSAFCMFWIDGVAVGSKPPEIDFSVATESASGSTLSPPTRLLAFAPDGNRLKGVVRIDLAALEPGAWQLHVTAKPKDPSVGAPAELRLPFLVEGAATSSGP